MLRRPGLLRRARSNNKHRIDMKDLMTSFTRTTLLLLALPLLLAGLATAQQMERTFNIDAGKRLDLNLETGGGITITGWDKNQVAVTANRHGRDADKIDVEMDERSSGLSIRTSHNWRRGNGGVDFEIRVPRRFNVTLETMGGEIKITGVEGRFRGQTMGGEINLADLRGEVDLKTMGGDITLRDSSVDGEVETMGGEVYISDVTGNVKGTTMGGEVTYRNVKTGGRDGAEAREVRINTMGGDINLDDAVGGADVHTMGGEIHVRSAKDHVKAKTMGGEIVIEEIDGWVEATTMGGDVEVNMIGNPARGDRHVELSSMGGDIILTVPPGLAMKVDIEIAFTRDARESYRIESDFGIEQEVTKDWIRDNGSPRKYISGTGTIGAGTHRIKIKTVNGNVYLKRGR